MNSIEDLIAVLTLEKKSKKKYIGVSKTIGSPNVFGGQVLAQALSAANNSVSDHRVLHSLHAYFLEAGNLELPIIYSVKEMRDGGSFSTRRVTAKQNGKRIFILAASFHKKEEGHEHQQGCKSDIKQPEELLSWSDMLDQMGEFLPKQLKYFLEIERPIEFKPTFIVNPLDLKDLPPFSDVWFKVKGNPTNVDLAVKQQILTYISDYNILNSTLYPNASKANFGNTQMASLDHSMWFFRDFDLDDWMLYKTESPNAFGARGFARGNIYSRKGDLIASVAQEGLIRPLKKQ
ncbi:acyl-CoA thioesterase [Polaribacter gochangensis]|uniref:acyl-CoA thioesterase n=1 Tax=Polaribacter gochangensis TaxID=3252903 RepID=UPI0039047547